MAAKTSEWRPGPTVCRCCLSEGCYKDISTEYFWMGKREVYSEMLSDTFDLSISYSKSGGPNSASRLICEPCIGRLRDAAEFKRQVQECEKTFVQCLDPVTALADMQVTLELEKEVKVEMVKEEKMRLSDDDDYGAHDYGDDDDDYDDLDDQPLTKLASKIPKKEDVDVLDLLDNAKVTEKRKSSTKVKGQPSKKSKCKQTAGSSKQQKPEPKKKKGADSLPTDRPTPAKRIVPLFQVAYDRTLCKPLGTVTAFRKLRLKDRISTPSPISMRDYTPSRSPSPVSLRERNSPAIEVPKIMKVISTKKHSDYRQNALTVFEFSTVYPFVYGNNKFKCFVCAEPFLETSLLRQHMNENHTFAPLKRLVNNRRENVLKVDVGELECKLCSVKPKDLLQLKYHLKEDHQKPIDPDLQDNMIPFKLEEENGAYKCVICEGTFIKVRILVIHMSVHFSNYSCEICGSGFMTLRLLKKHLEVHETGNFPCDRCNKVFSTTYKRALHVRGVHLKQYPRRCPICPERFNSNYRRTIHLQNVHNQSTRVHKCETCGRGFNLKYHLICHNRSVHLQERNHQCKVCLQRFCNKETLKRHMVIHTGEKNHKCDLCGMAFLRRKNLKDHLRLHDVV
ncbi:zinc finger protein 652 isoform X4 [Bicyclus anynana]|uniref:Zinc finger protein 652 isoform X4 n=1 Tax=Bicyclus anynana TaxID=110368 RepID=A0A6J1N3Z7_BICAN|nr:zinc finger protein 652 isoform X4 [Bicyclus anynana]